MEYSPWLKQLGLPALAGSLAVCFTHPLELTKIRLQLDNELAQRGTPKKYSGWVDCVLKNWRSRGVRGLQGGLALGVTREFFFNGLRIGLFDPLVGMVHASSGRDQAATPQADEKLAAGLAAGALGGLLINPIDVLKTRAQALGGETGHQHKPLLSSVSLSSSRAPSCGTIESAAAVKATTSATPLIRFVGSPIHALQGLLREEGWRGLFRGVGTNTMRGLLGPGSQIAAYTLLKERASSWSGGKFKSANVSTHVMCSLVSAAVSVAVVNPVDVLRTRLFNQPVEASTGQGLWYRSGPDALAKVVEAEGPLALYKGAGSHFLRLGPHMVLVFVFLEQFKIMASS